MNADSDTIRTELAKFINKHPRGRVDLDQLHDWIQANPDSDLYAMLEWDDSIAGRRDRIRQCRALVKNWHPVEQPKQVATIKQYVHVEMIPADVNVYTRIGNADRAEVSAAVRRHILNASGNLHSALDIIRQSEHVADEVRDLLDQIAATCEQISEWREILANVEAA